MMFHAPAFVSRQSGSAAGRLCAQTGKDWHGLIGLIPRLHNKGDFT